MYKRHRSTGQPTPSIIRRGRVSSCNGWISEAMSKCFYKKDSRRWKLEEGCKVTPPLNDTYSNVQHSKG
uniref:Uncharacterized protein n=1 Tax=Coccidioides posadasii RMSCC 3488 TaxID=454284 RepID=A0A0J6FM56_COCPO|nr:hypothetical protein CPAG_07765 [Coccidioides posadasii RMSCC 3488]